MIRETPSHDGWRASDTLVVVGRRSYVGRCLARHAEARGTRVVSIGSPECDFRDPQQVTAFFGSLTEPCTVAFCTVVNKGVDNSFDAFQSNVAMVRNLVEAQRRAPVRSILYLSSVDVYGRRPPVPLTEAAPIAPDSWYGLAKCVCEMLLTGWMAPACPVVVLRIPGIYGHGEGDKSVLGRMVSDARVHGKIRITGDGAVRRDYVYVDDLCRLMNELIRLRYRGVLNVATGESRSLRDLATLVARACGTEVDVIHEPADPARAFDLEFDTRALRTAVPSFRFSDPEVGLASYLPTSAVMAGRGQGPAARAMDSRR